MRSVPTSIVHRTGVLNFSSFRVTHFMLGPANGVRGRGLTIHTRHGSLNILPTMGHVGAVTSRRPRLAGCLCVACTMRKCSMGCCGGRGSMIILNSNTCHVNDSMRFS